MAKMASDRPSDTESRVVLFPRRRTRAPLHTPSPVDDLAKFERGEGADDYRHRMIVNFAAFVLVLGLIGTGLWLADIMAEMRKNEDCVLSGRRGCARIEVNTHR